MSIRKKIFWSVLSLALAGFTIWAVLSQVGEMPLRQLAGEIREANKLYLAAACVCGALFILLEARAILHLLHGAGYGRGIGSGVIYSAADIYFSGVTPSATGGQPASAIFMIRDGIPTGVVTVALIINLILYTVSIVLLGLGAVVTHAGLFFSFRLVSRILIGIGFAILSTLTVFFFLLLGSGGRFFGFVASFLRFLHRHKMIRLLEPRLEKLKQAEADYADCVRLMRDKPGDLFRAFVCNFLQRASQIAVPMFIHMAMGGSAALAGRIYASECFITIGFNCVPVPGAIGVADYLMVDGFSDLIGLDDALRLEILSRSISFYLCVAVSGLLILAGYFLQRKKKDGARA